jgi:Holliday junction resolvase
MATHYQQGYAFEARVRKLLDDKGFITIRNSKSRFPDFAALGMKVCFIAECKSSHSIPMNTEKLLSDEEYNKALQIITSIDKPFVLFHRNKEHKTKIDFTVIGGYKLLEINEALR